jgi:hypothetical protein
VGAAARRARSPKINYFTQAPVQEEDVKRSIQQAASYGLFSAIYLSLPHRFGSLSTN